VSNPCLQQASSAPRARIANSKFKLFSCLAGFVLGIVCPQVSIGVTDDHECRHWIWSGLTIDNYLSDVIDFTPLLMRDMDLEFGETADDKIRCWRG
jgi:hypothetical protein